MSKGKPPKALREYMAQIGKKGGEAAGDRKKRSTEHYRAAARKRWDKQKGKKP